MRVSEVFALVRQQRLLLWGLFLLFGFITAAAGSDVFVHYSLSEGGVFKSLTEGDAVSFDTKQDTRELNAVKIYVTAKVPPGLLAEGIFILYQYLKWGK